MEAAKLSGAIHQVLVGLTRNAFISEQYQNLSFDHMHFQLACAYNIEFTSLKLLVDQHDAMIAALENPDKAGLIALLSAHFNELNSGGVG